MRAWIRDAANGISVWTRRGLNEVYAGEWRNSLIVVHARDSLNELLMGFWLDKKRDLHMATVRRCYLTKAALFLKLTIVYGTAYNDGMVFVLRGVIDGLICASHFNFHYLSLLSTFSTVFPGRNRKMFFSILQSRRTRETSALGSLGKVCLEAPRKGSKDFWVNATFFL